MAISPDAPSDTVGVLFFGYAMFAAVDWLYSKIFDHRHHTAPGEPDG